LRLCQTFAALVLLACGRQDGIVGVAPLGAAGASAAGFFDEFAENTGIWAEQTAVEGAATSFGEPASNARDERLLRLTFPGHPDYAASDRVGAEHATQVGTSARFHFGTYRTRLGFGGCAANEETVMAFLGYFNDGEDHDGDGIVDDLEIDVQLACGAPSRLYLTVFTDYEATAQGERFRKQSRVVDFASGELFDTPAVDSDRFAAAGIDAQLIAPELLEPDALYELGFEWHSDSIRFFLGLNGGERELWQLSGAERVPQLPVHIVYNLWHPDSHWYPSEGSADYPARDVLMSVDWVSFEPE
jgi:hypothetical protein